MDWGNCLQTITDSNGKAAQVPTLNCIPYVFKNLINVALVFAGTVAVIFIIYAGMKYIRSGGDPKQTQSARQTITFAIIGLLIILLSFAIVNFISAFTGVQCIKLMGFTNCQ